MKILLADIFKLTYNVGMKKFAVLILSLCVFSSAAFAGGLKKPFRIGKKTKAEQTQPAADTAFEENKEEKTPVNVKPSSVTQMRYDAFQTLVPAIDPSEFAERAEIPLYVTDKYGDFKKVHRKNVKSAEYTNDTYSLKFKDTPDKLYFYDVMSSKLVDYVVMSNNGKIPYTAYHYNSDGILNAIEIKASRYHSYFYGADGMMTKYFFYNDCFAPSGKKLYSKKGM